LAPESRETRGLGVGPIRAYLRQAMFSKGSKSSPMTSPRASAFSAAVTSHIADQKESNRSSSDSAAVAHSDSRPIESHWESVIDRATD